MTEPMNEGVRMLIERMKTNPEEFDIEDGALYSSNKWGKLLHNALRDDVFCEEECGAVREAFRQVRRDNFTSDVLRALTVEEDHIIKKEWVTSTTSNGMFVAPNFTTPNLQIGSTTLSENELKRIKSAVVTLKGASK